MNTIKALIVKKHWLDLILDGTKTWEIRSSNTNIRGMVGLIESGSGQVKGTVEIIDSHPVTIPELLQQADKHRIPAEKCQTLSYLHPHAWVMQNAKRFEEPLPYVHPQGAVIWVNIENLSQEE